MNKFKEILFLKQLKRVGKKTIYKKYWNVLSEYDDIDDLLTQLEYEFQIPIDQLETAKKKAEIIYDDVVNDPDITVITVFDEDYPKKLNVMGNDRPLILYVKGSTDSLNKENIAVIGTRKPSNNSQIFEENMVKSILNDSDRVIVSGLALGCDKIAHQTTVDENKVTIAVLPSGVNIINPAQHKKLASLIIEKGGCLISEYEPDMDVYKGTFVERDGIVAAFSDASFVIECGVKSGTMHTVDAAKKYNRTIFAYMPDEKPEGSYDGNEYILENKNGIRVSDVEDYFKTLEELKSKKKSNITQNDSGDGFNVENTIDSSNDSKKTSHDSKQQTLDFF